MSGGSRGKGGRKFRVPHEANNFLDEIGGVGEVRTPRGRGNGQLAPIDRDRAPDSFECGDPVVNRNVHSRNLRGQVTKDANESLLHGRFHRGHSLIGPAREIHEQLAGPGRCDRGEHAIDSSFEPTTGFTREPVAAPHPRHDLRAEVGRLERDVLGVVCNLCRGPTHRSCQTNRSAIVTDRQVVDGQGALDVVDRLQRLFRLRPTGAHSPLQRVEVESVQRLP